MYTQHPGNDPSKPRSQDNIGAYALLRGERTLREGGLIIVGASIGNSYFTAERFAAIHNFIEKHGCAAMIMITDGPGVHNFVALGRYSEKSAQRSAANQGDRLRKICESAGISASKIVNWADVYKDNDYQAALHGIDELWNQNFEFRADICAEVRKYFKNHLKSEVELNEQQVNRGARYLLEEFACIRAACRIYKASICSYLYHRHWPIYEKFVAGHYDGIQKEEGLIVYVPDGQNV